MVRAAGVRRHAVAALAVVEPLALVAQSVRPLADAVPRPPVVLPLARVRLDGGRVDRRRVAVPGRRRHGVRQVAGAAAATQGGGGGEAGAKRVGQLAAEERRAPRRRVVAGAVGVRRRRLDALAGHEEADATRRRGGGGGRRQERLAGGDGAGPGVLQVPDGRVLGGGGGRSRGRLSGRRVEFEDAADGRERAAVIRSVTTTRRRVQVDGALTYPVAVSRAFHPLALIGTWTSAASVSIEHTGKTTQIISNSDGATT